MRELFAAILVPVLIITGFRFSKEWRRAETGFKAKIFKRLNTTQANLWAKAITDFIYIYK